MKITNLANPFRRHKNTKEDDLGFGNWITRSDIRLINPDGSFNIRRTGVLAINPYQWVMDLSWPLFFLVIILFYGMINAVFALCFMLIGIENLIGVPDGGRWMDFAHAFFFSVQTFTTVGYGAISPDGLAANLIASADAMVGLMAFALATGLFFARFSKPQAQILFCPQALISPHRGGSAFMFRIAGKNHKKIIDLSAVVTMTWVESNGKGAFTRRFANMPLERSKIVLFPLNWTLVHPIDESSPLYGMGSKDLERLNAEFLVLIEGFDETYAQQVHASRSFTWREIIWGHKYAPMYRTGAGETILELDKIGAHFPILEEEE